MKVNITECRYKWETTVLKSFPGAEVNKVFTRSFVRLKYISALAVKYGISLRKNLVVKVPQN